MSPPRRYPPRRESGCHAREVSTGGATVVRMLSGRRGRPRSDRSHHSAVGVPAGQYRGRRPDGTSRWLPRAGPTGRLSGQDSPQSHAPKLGRTCNQRWRTHRWQWVAPLACLMAVLVALLPAASAPAAGTITYVQGSYADPQSPQTSVAVTFTGAQTAGDLNVIVVGWNDSTSSVASVTDSIHNTYALAVGPTILSGFGSQSIYYAKAIAGAGAGANTVTVTFSQPASFPDIRILEYSGTDQVNPVDVTAAQTGSSTSTSSGTATTKSAADVIFGANLVETTTTAPGSGFTKRLLTSPDADIAQDRVVSSTGSYTSTAPVSPSGRWIMQMVAFRAS